MSWLMCGTVCSRRLLTRPSKTAESNWQHACMQMDNILDIYCKRVWLTKVMNNTSNSKRCSFTAELMIFGVSKFPKVRYVGTYNKQVRWYIKQLFNGIFTQQYLYQKLLESDNYCWNYRWWLGGIIFLRHSVDVILISRNFFSFVMWLLAKFPRPNRRTDF